jgi:Tol biopolymer transport system component/DNA-binding winged helix-turn-helix (wHTH) protein
MASTPSESPKIRFGLFELDVAAGRLLKAGTPLKLGPQPLRVLLLLIRKEGQVVTREEIQKSLWGETTFVDFQHGINFSVNQIRAALCDDAEKPRYIETLPRIGYRFIASVNEERENSVKIVAGDPAGISTLPPTEIPTGRKQFRTLGLLAGISLILGIGYIARYYLSRSKGPNLQHIRITKLTDSGTAEDMAISPDGRYVVYSQTDGEKESLRLNQVVTRRDVEIVPPDTTGFHGLTFSRDGNYIYFVRSDKNDPVFKYLYAMPTLGGAARKLIADVDSPISFSPDGHQLVYERSVPARNEIELRVADSDGVAERLLVTIPQANGSLYQPGPSWSPDGKTIVVPVLQTGKQQRWLLNAVNVSTGHMRQLYSSAYDMGRPVWLSGGNALLIPHYDPDSAREQLWTISFPEGRPSRLTNDLSEYGTALDIVGGGEVAAGITKNMISNVWEVTNGTPTSDRQITSGNLPFSEVAYAVDGKILSMSTDGRLWVLNSSGERMLVAEEAGWMTACSSFVVFASYKGGVATLIRANLDGSNPTKLVEDGLFRPSRTSLSTRAPACSPDGKFVFFVGAVGPRKIYRVPIGGGTPLEISEIPGDFIVGRLSVSPNGKLLAYLYERYRGTKSPGWKFAVTSVDGGTALKIFDAPGGIQGLRWSPDGGSLQYLLTQNGTTNLWEQPLTGEAPRKLTDFSSGQVFDFSWSTDRRHLVMARGTRSSDVVLLRGLR